MKIWELTEPQMDVVLKLKEYKDPKQGLIETALHFELPVEEITAIYRRHLHETSDILDSVHRRIAKWEAYLNWPVFEKRRNEMFNVKLLGRLQSVYDDGEPIGVIQPSQGRPTEVELIGATVVEKTSEDFQHVYGATKYILIP